MTQTVNLYKALVSILKEQQRKYHGETKVINRETTFLFHALNRLLKNLHSIIILLESSPYDNEHLIELGLRNIMTDLFVVRYVFSNREKSLELIDDLYYDDVKRSIEFFKLMEGNGGIPIGYNKILENEYGKEDWYVNAKSRMKKTEKRFPSSSEIFKMYKNVSDDEVLKRMFNAYDKWVYFSKSEHIGWFSYLKINSSKDDYYMEKRLLECLCSAMYSAIISLQMLNDMKSLDLINSVYLELETRLKEYA